MSIPSSPSSLFPKPGIEHNVATICINISKKDLSKDLQTNDPKCHANLFNLALHITLLPVLNDLEINVLIFQE